jgi:hypothetical protein
VTRLSHLSVEEIAGAVLLVVVLLVALARPGPIAQLFESPYSTPAPGGGPARQLVPAATSSPASGVPDQRSIGVGLPTLRGRP